MSTEEILRSLELTVSWEEDSEAWVAHVASPKDVLTLVAEGGETPEAAIGALRLTLEDVIKDLDEKELADLTEVIVNN